MHGLSTIGRHLPMPAVRIAHGVSVWAMALCTATVRQHIATMFGRCVAGGQYRQSRPGFKSTNFKAKWSLYRG